MAGSEIRELIFEVREADEGGYVARALRTRLALELNELIARMGLTQTKVAALLGIPQPHLSELKHFKLTRFTSERLLRFLTLLDRDVEIVIRPKAGRRATGRLSVSVG